MNVVPRILLVQDTSDVGRLILAALAENNLLEQTYVVGDEHEAREFFATHPSKYGEGAGLPGIVLLGMDLPPMKSLWLIEHLRGDAKLQRMPIVMIVSSPGGQVLRRAYELGANGVVVMTDREDTNAERLRAVWQFWILANVPPPGCLRCHETDEGERA